MNAVFPFRDGFYAHKGIVFLHPLNLPFIFVAVDRAGTIDKGTAWLQVLNRMIQKLPLNPDQLLSGFLCDGVAYLRLSADDAKA